jgi:transcriptional regulator with XRE-family HTH domain
MSAMALTTFGSIIRHLLDQKLTSLKEIEEITGRGTSTIYRWMNGETEPHFTDMRLLVRRLGNPTARRTLVAMLTADLPIVVNWVGDEDFIGEDAAGGRHDGHDLLDRTIVALDCLTDIIAEAHDAVRGGTVSAESFAHLVNMMDEAIRHITASKNLLQRYSVARSQHASRAG